MRTEKNKYLIVIILLTIANGLQAQVLVPPSNANFSSLEKNMLFYADRRFTVTQTGSAQVYLPAMFDGNYGPSYTPVAPSVSDPTVITIEGLPLEHTQRGAYVGWTTRYWPATKFKIEGFTGDNVWTTIADEAAYGGYEYITYLHGVFSKLRFTFYTASGDNGLMGLSELFFLHSEAAQVYDGLMVKYDHDGNVGIGTSNVSYGGSTSSKFTVVQNDGGTGLLIGNQSKPRLALNGNADGSWTAYDYAADTWTAGLTQKSGKVGIGTTTPSELLSVNGNIRTRKVIVTQTGWPDYVFDSSYQLPSLGSVASFVQVNKHLPDMPSAATIEKDGHDVGEVQKLLLKKVEELTLYVIEQQKQIAELKSKNSTLEQTVGELKQKINLKLK